MPYFYKAFALFLQEDGEFCHEYFGDRGGVIYDEEASFIDFCDTDVKA